VELIFGLGLCWGRFSDKDFTSQRQLQMQQIWFKNVKIAKGGQRPETTFVFNPANTSYLATAKVGYGFVRTTPTSTRQPEICCGGSGVLL
jgi:hypothetical protein